MGEFSITKWKCDRCGCVHDQRPPTHYLRHTVKVSQHQEWAGGILMDWKEMCAACDQEIAEGLKGLLTIKHNKEPTP